MTKQNAHSTGERLLLSTAEPVCAVVTGLAKGEALAGGKDLGRRLEQTMASAMACMRTAARQPGGVAAVLHLAGAEDLVRRVLEDMCFAHMDGFVCAESYTHAFGACASLCRELHETRAAAENGHPPLALAG